MAPIRCLLNGSKIKYRPYHTNSPPPLFTKFWLIEWVGGITAPEENQRQSLIIEK